MGSGMMGGMGGGRPPMGATGGMMGPGAGNMAQQPTQIKLKSTTITELKPGEKKVASAG
jgi:hypothetical protein